MHTLESTSGSEEARQFLASIVESSQDSIISVSFEGIITSWNAAAEVLYGYSAVEAVGKPLSMLTLPEDLREILGNVDKIKHSREVETFETERIGKDGHHVFLEVTMSPVKNDGGEVIGVSTIARDITERKRTEEVLRESEEKFRSIVETTSEWIWAMDAQGNSTYSNPAVETILGYTPEEFLGTDFRDFMHKEDCRRVEELLPVFIADKRGWRDLVMRWHHKDRSVRYLESNAVPIFNADGELTGFRGADRDITDRKRADEAVRRSEENLANAQRIANIGSWETDLVTNQIFWSDEVYRIFGVSKDNFEITLEVFFGFIHPEDRQLVQEAADAAFSQNAPYELEHRLITQTGEEKIVCAIGEVTFDESGNPLRFIGTVQDITKRVAAETEMRLMKSAFGSIAEGIIIADALNPDNPIIYANAAFETLTGYSFEEIEGQNCRFLQGTDTNPRTVDKIREALVTKTTFQGEILNYRKNGESFWNELVISPVFDQSGQLTNFVGVQQDISERKHVEIEKEQLAAQVAHHHKRLNDIVANVPGVVWEAWGEPDAETQRIDFVSDYVEMMLGYTVEEWITTPNFWLSIVHPEDKKRIARDAAERFHTGEGYTRQFRWIAKDGRIVWVESQATVIRDETGQPIGLRGINIDITERKRLEDERIKLTAELDFEKARLQHIFDNSPSFIVSLRGPDYVFETVNPAYYKIVGQRKLIGVPAREALPELAGQGFLELLDRVYTTGESFIAIETAVKLQSSSGEAEKQVYINFTYMPMRESDGTISGILSYGVDVTEQVLSRLKIQESAREQQKLAVQLETERARLVAAQQVAKVGSWENDLLTQKVTWSAETFHIFEIDPREFQSDHQGFLQLVHPDDRAAVNEALVKSFDRHSVCSFEHRIVLADGRIKFIDERWEIIRDEHGKPLHAIGTCQDITERKQAEQLVIESEERYRLLFENSPLPMWVFDLETLRFLSVNEAAINLYGYSRQEFLTMSLPDIRLPEDLPILFQTVAKDSPGISKVGVVRHRNKNGTIFYADVVTNQLIFEGRRAKLALAKDVTQRQKAQQAVRFQAHLLNTVEQSVIATDLDGIITYWNQFAEKLYGWTSAEAIGRTARELTTPQINRRQAKQVMARLNAGESWIGELVMRNKAGDDFPAHVSISPVTDETGKIIGLVAVSVDITERKNAETALQQAEDKYRSLVESLPAIVYLFEPNPPYSPIYISPNISNFGYALEEWFDRPDMWMSVIHPEDKPEVLRITENAMRQDLNTNVEYRIIAGDGKIYWVQDRGHFVSDDEGRRTGWQGVMLDVTETKALEERLRQAQKLESVGLLAGGIAHDFNNMLTVINGYSDLTLLKLKADDPLRSNIEEIKKAGERSAALTHQLLAFSRQQVLQPVIINLNESIAETSKMLERLLGEDIQLRITLNSKVGCIKADPGQFSQIIMNLAINARDAMPQGGKLTIETDNVFLNSDYARRHADVLPGAYVMLTVSDDGTGMNDITKEHLFEPFYTTKALGQGTGLGLATVYGIIKQSGGSIEVYSEEGLGTTFKVYLPRIAEQNTPDEIKGTSVELPKGTETILLVEDEDLVRHLSRQILQESGYTVIEARNGLHALEICEQGDKKFDLLVTDVVMPQMGGRELAEKLSSRMPEIKILFTSGYTNDAIVRHGVIEAETNFIKKPFSPDKLAEKIREVLDGV